MVCVARRDLDGDPPVELPSDRSFARDLDGDAKAAAAWLETALRLAESGDEEHDCDSHEGTHAAWDLGGPLRFPRCPQGEGEGQGRPSAVR